MRDIDRWEKISQGIRNRLFPPRIALGLSCCRNMPTDFPGSCYIFGDTDTGKTMIAAQYLMNCYRDAWLNGNTILAVFTNTDDLLREIKATFERGSSVTEADLLKKYRECDVLLLDDFGLVKPTDWVYQVFYGIINYRYDNMKTTILTSNNSLARVEEIFEDSRIVSRIRRQCRVLKKESYKTK